MPAGQRRQPGQRLAVQLLDDGCGSAASGSPPAGSPAGTSPVQVSSPSTAVSAAALPRADERPARPGPPVLRRLEQERARAVAGELAVDPDRGLVVGEQPAGHRDHPVLDGELAELRAAGGDRSERRRCGRGR